MARRRKRRILLKFLIAILALALVCALLLKFVFVVRDVDVGGNPGSMSAESVIRAARLNFGASIFGVDGEKVAENIGATGVLRCEDVQLQYPDTVLLTVQARTRAAMALHLGKIHVLDETGCVITSLDDVPGENLVYISGLRVQGCTAGKVIQADADQLKAYCEVMQALLSAGAEAYVSEMNLDNPADIRIITRTGITVELGGSENARNKIAWMQGAVSDLEARGQAGGVLDVRSGTKADYRAAN